MAWIRAHKLCCKSQALFPLDHGALPKKDNLMKHKIESVRRSVFMVSSTFLLSLAVNVLKVIAQ